MYHKAVMATSEDIQQVDDRSLEAALGFDQVLEQGAFNTLSNILTGTLVEVLGQTGEDNWSRLLYTALSQAMREAAHEPAATLSDLGQSLIGVAPAIQQQVNEREAREDAREAIINALPEEQREILRGW